MTWNNRIVGTGVERADKLLPNGLNFRTHSNTQRAAMQDAFEQVGWADSALVNKRSDAAWGEARYQRTLIDGHMRVAMALESGNMDVPVTYVDLSPDEERLALATYDPIGSLAVADAQMHNDLLAQVAADFPSADALLASMRTPESDAGEAASSGDEAAAPELDELIVAVGPLHFMVHRAAYLAWRESLYQSVGFATPDILAEIEQRLGV